MKGMLKETPPPASDGLAQADSTKAPGQSLSVNRPWPAPRICHLVALAVVLGISAYLRYYNLGTNPGWDLDEGYNINIAWNLSQGRMQMYATTFAFVQHPPLFYLVSAFLFSLFGPDILVLRGLTATLGVLTTAALYPLGREIAGPRIGLLASSIFAIYPLAVAHNRWGYSYNLLMLISMLVVYLTWKATHQTGRKSAARHLLLAGFLAGLGMVSDQEGVFLIVAVVLLAWFIARANFAHVVVASLSAPVSYALVMLSLLPSEFLSDWVHNWSRAAGDNLLVQSIVLGVSYHNLLTFDYWIPLGLVGLFLVPSRKARMVLLVFVALMLFIILKIRPVNPFFRTAVPILPFVCLGLSVLVDRGFDYVQSWLTISLPSCLHWPAVRSTVATLMVFVVLFTPFAAATIIDVVGIQTVLRTKIDDFLVSTPDDARAAAEVVNSLTTPHDVVLVSPNTSWLYRARTADLLQSVAAEGKGTAFYPEKMPPERFVYDPRYTRAKLVVLDRFSEIWAASMPEEARIVEKIRTEWQAVFRQGEYVVYRNPKP
ncbi:MAG: glycosyltransferase family 39 protein [Chloroflexi bacterium]|nr:glycosyltransferase family 39 protein [Chloroflexota bacterium]